MWTAPASSMEILNAWAASMVAVGWLHFVQVAILAGLLAVVDFAVGRRIGAHWRCALWLLFFCKLVLPPQLAVPTSPAYWLSRHDSAPAAPVMPALALTPRPPTPAQVWTAEGKPGDPVGTSLMTKSPSARPNWQLAVATAWLAGVIVLGGATWIRHRRLARDLRRSDPASPSLEATMARARAQVGLRRDVALRISPAGIGPLVTGLSRPTVHLPQPLVARLAPAELEAVLVHELHHVRRGDLWVAAVQSLARILFFHHPAVWWVNAHLSRLREEATDRAVLAHREIDRRAYSIALLEAAALFTSRATANQLALGVIETKSQLQKRITMNLSQPRPRRVQLGRSGLFSLALLALVLVPMMPAEPALEIPGAPAGFKVADPAPVAQRVNRATTSILEAFNRHDREAFVAAFAETPLLLPNGGGLIATRSGVNEMYLRVPSGLLYEPMTWCDRRFHVLGGWVVETGLVNFQFRLHADAPVMSDPRQALTIWEEGADGVLRVKLLAWNALAEPAALQREVADQAFAATRDPGAFVVDTGSSPVLELEETFHREFDVRKPGDPARYYADQATLIPPGNLPIYGQPAIRRYLEGIPISQRATHVERAVAHVEKSNDHVLVVNIFRWSFRPTGADVDLAVAGKGVHLWQRQDDGTWKILFDLPNVSQPTA